MTVPRKRRPYADSSWSCYPQTVLELHDPEHIVAIDLRRLLTEEQCRTLTTIGPSPTFGVITAFNPVGRQAASTDNAARHERLRESLTCSAAVHVPADGVSPNGSHREEGFAVWLECDAAASFALQFEQSAFFWFDGQSFWVIGALVDAAPLRLPAMVANHRSPGAGSR
jgi:hypothetical protein